MKTILRLFAFAVLITAAYSCIREDMDDCLQYSLKVKAVDIEGNDITTSGTLTSVDIYLFDENGFVRMVPQGSSTDFLLGADKQKPLTLVAWGNLKSDTLKMPELAVGTPLKDARIELIQKEDGYHLPATDIFYSRQEVTGTATRGMLEETLVLTLERRVAGMTIRTKNLENKFGAGTPCHFVVYGVGNALNFMGEPTGGTVGYHPQVNHDDVNDIQAPAFRILPTPQENALSLRLCRGDKVLYTITTDSEGNPLMANPGEHLNIMIDFEAPVDPDTPDNPNNPDDPDNPNNPDDPNNPNNPDIPDNPEGPDEPDVPDTPKTTIKVTVNVEEWGNINQDTQV